MSVPVDLSSDQARGIALAAQGFGRPRPTGSVNLGHLRRLLTLLGAVQIDAVNVLARAHYLPFFSRLGPYSVDLVDRLTYQRHVAFEYAAHAASIVPIELYPALRHRMDGYGLDPAWLSTQARIERERPGYLATVLREVAERGPLAFGDLADPAPREKSQNRYAESTLLWYRWSDGKSVLEGLFAAGRLAVAGRRGFDRLYDLPERVHPAEILALPPLDQADGQRELVRRAMSALGVAMVKEVADYFRLPVAAARARLRELQDAGEVIPARVEGWPGPAYLAASARVSATLDGAAALLSPFDSLIWERDRTERLFGFRHSFELYVPAARRQYGYYVLPFLLGDALVARVDLKADRPARPRAGQAASGSAGTLRVQGAFAEPGTKPPAIAGALAPELGELAAWLGLDSIEVTDRGDLAADLRMAIKP